MARNINDLTTSDSLSLYRRIRARARNGDIRKRCQRLSAAGTAVAPITQGPIPELGRVGEMEFRNLWLGPNWPRFCRHHPSPLGPPGCSLCLLFSKTEKENPARKGLILGNKSSPLLPAHGCKDLSVSAAEVIQACLAVSHTA